MAGPDRPRALVLSEDDRAIVIRRLAKALLRFQDSFLDREGSPAGLLCQVWLPEVTSEGEVTLRTKGMPFCVAGLGDLLALFRCISCRFAFGTDIKKAAQLGAPGRVFTSSEPELTCNVQKYSKTAYLRKAEAEQCHVQSTLLLPVFLSAARHGCVGVLEVVQTSEDMQFTEVADLIASVMEKCELFTSTRASIERQLPRAAAAAGQVMLPASVDVLRPVHTAGSEDSGERANSTDGAPMADEAILEQATMGGSGGALRGEVGSQDQAQLRQGGALAAAVTAARPAASRGGGGGGAHLPQVSDEDDEDMGEDSEGEDEAEGFGGSAGGAGRAVQTKSVGTVGTRRRGKGTGNPGKPGVRLRLEDLQSQFGVGLKEAAARLGICPTTLKRACRRHGIQRWPRRQLAKVNQVLDQMDVQGGAALLQQQQAQQLGALGGGLPAPDTRWTALAQFIPQLRQTVNYGDTLLGGFGAGQQHLQGMGPLPQIGTGPANGAALDMLGWGAGAAAGSGGAVAGAGVGPLGNTFGGPVGGVPQFVELPSGGPSILPQQAQQQAQQPVKADGLPRGVLPAPPQLWGMAANAAEGPALSGLSSLGQPPPAAGSDAGAAAVQRLSALKAITAARGGSGAVGGSGVAGGLSGGTPLPIGALNNLGGLSSCSWGMPSTPHLLGTSLDFDLVALAQQTKAAAAQGGAGAANGGGGEARDDDVGFIDPSVLEMMLQEDANRGGAPMPLDQANHTLGISGVLNSLKFG